MIERCGTLARMVTSGTERSNCATSPKSPGASTIVVPGVAAANAALSSSPVRTEVPKLGLMPWASDATPGKARTP